MLWARPSRWRLDLTTSHYLLSPLPSGTVTSCQCNWSGRPLHPTLSWLDCAHSCSCSVCSQESSQLFYLNINQSFRFSSQSPAVASCLTPDESQSPSNSSQGMVMSRPAPLTPSFSSCSDEHCSTLIPPAMQEMWLWSLEDLLEKEVAARSSILAWRISWTEEPGGFPMGGGTHGVSRSQTGLTD